MEIGINGLYFSSFLLQNSLFGQTFFKKYEIPLGEVRPQKERMFIGTEIFSEYKLR